MSIVSNPAALLNGGHHGQQFTTLIPASNMVNSLGDNPAGIKQKSTLLPNQVSNNEFHLSEANGDAGLSRENNEGGVEMSSSITPTEGESRVSAEDDTPCIDIIINNVVCSFSTKCYLNLKKIATEGLHVEYRRENGMLNMKIRRPNVTATIWSSGNITCTGSTSEDEARVSARRIARRLQRLGFNTRFSNYRVVNVLGTCSLMLEERKALRKQGVHVPLHLTGMDDDGEDDDEDESVYMGRFGHLGNHEEDDDDDDFSDDFDSDVSHD
ncbi:TATA-box binding protein [Plakobranchus ocellatus]|uniref:TATA-box binding protein n=1 Tax=Plakobranchus ocellatus TaxID=259542 RepID=A0AAV3Z204_9GAST|nr:TATA-box binding protein [Plakobranchus ocellatus]